MRRHLLFAAFAACAGLLPFAAPSYAQTPEKPKLSIGVGGKSLFYYLPLTIAERQGYFKAEGLDVEILDFPGGARALQALLQGYSDSCAFQVAVVHAFRGEIDAAFEWLDRAYAQRDHGLHSVREPFHLRNLHADARWPAFLARMGLAG